MRESLTPYLGLDNFQVSVTARLNTDRKQITETTYDPESRVERSVRVVKENEASNNSSQSVATSVSRTSRRRRMARMAATTPAPPTTGARKSPTTSCPRRR